MNRQNSALDVEEDDFVDELKPGTSLMHGQYTVERFLAAGGFGITYLARDSLNRCVVIKECFPGNFCRRQNASVLPRSRAHQAQLRSIVELFSHEALNLAKTRHPNIVGVHQVFDENNTAYMALDYVQGRDLLEILNDDPASLKPEMVERYLTKVLDAVRHIHEMGILHRDIAPDNIIINEQGEPVLIDFGAARENTDENVTRMLSALRVVKDGYSPQEFYISGSEQTPSCDLYSLAASFYHVITDELPPDAQWRLSAFAAGDPDPLKPVADRAPGYSREFLVSLSKALSILPRDRMQSAQEWIDALATPTPFVVPSVSKETSVSEPSPRKKSVMPLVLGTSGLVAAIGIGAVFLPSADTETLPQPMLQDTASAVTQQVPAVEATPLGRSTEEAEIEAGALNPALMPPTEREDMTTRDTVADAAAEPGPIPLSDPIEPDLAEVNLDLQLPRQPLLDTAGVEELPSFGTPLIDGLTIPLSDPLRLVDLGSIAAFETRPSVDLTVPALTLARREIGSSTSAASSDAIAQSAPSGVDFFVSMAKSQPELKSVLASPMRTSPETGASPTQSTANQVSRPTSIISNFVPVTPFNLSPSEPGRILEVAFDGPDWLTQDLRIVSINGQPVSTNGQINANFAQLASGAGSSRFDVELGLTSNLTGSSFERSLSVGTEKHTLLLNGLTFVSVKDANGWSTKVIDAPNNSGFEVGDTLVSYVATWEDLDGPESLITILERDMANGTTNFSFAVERGGEIWIESFNLAATGN